jgi:uncharacterized protein (TIGR03437 family)
MVGVFQVNVELPAAAAPEGSLPLVLSAGGQASPPVPIAMK